jgi:hypothetical protein
MVNLTKFIPNIKFPVIAFLYYSHFLTYNIAMLRYFWEGQQTCNLDTFEKGVALYTGNWQGPDITGTTPGILRFFAANWNCAQFKTCGTNGDTVNGASSINLQMIAYFNEFQEKSSTDNCGTTAPLLLPIVNGIRTVFIVSMVQDVLYWADYYNDQPAVLVSHRFTGALYTAVLLPYLYSCNADDAAVMYNKMNYGTGIDVFISVKAVLEKNYQCLGISCKDVGELQNFKGVYPTPVVQCGDPTNPSPSAPVPVHVPAPVPAPAPKPKTCKKLGARCSSKNSCCTKKCYAFIIWKRCSAR